MFRYCIFLLLAALPIVGFSQELNKKVKKGRDQPLNVFVDVSGGVSFATGLYSSTDRDNKKAGYAATGYFIQLNADWMGKKNFGLAFQYCFQHNPFEESAEKDTLYGTLHPLGEKGWSNHFLFAGPVFVKSFKRLSVDARALIGAVLSFSQVFSNTDPVTLENVTNTAPGLAWQLGIGLGFDITPRLTVKGSIGYIGASPKVDKSLATRYPADTTSGTPPFMNLTEIRISKSVSAFNAGVGIIYRF